MEIAKLLSGSEWSYTLDRALFYKWENGQISTKMAIESFKKNNFVDEGLYIEPRCFTMWLYSLGYRR